VAGLRHLQRIGQLGLALLQRILRPLVLGDVAGYCLEARHLAIFLDQLTVLSKPDLTAIFRENGEFGIGIINPLCDLAAEERNSLFAYVRADQCWIVLADKLPFLVSGNSKSRLIYKCEMSRLVRPVDKITCIFHQCPIMSLSLPQRLERSLPLGFRLLALGDIFMHENKVFRFA
jgi:hypothetical protein